MLATGDDLDELRESLAEGIALVMAEGDEPAPTVRLSPVHAATGMTSATIEHVAA